MANTLATLEPLHNNRVITMNRLCNGDFVDLTSDDEPQKTVEDDVVLVDCPNGEDEIPLPIGSSRINNSSVTQQAPSFIVRKEDYSNITTKQFLVPSKTQRISASSGGVSKKLVSAFDPPGQKKDVLTVTLLPNTSERTATVLKTALQKASNKTKSAVNQQSLVANKNSPRAKSVTPKKPRVNIRKSSNIPSGSAPNIRIENCVLLPSSSEVGDQTAKKKRTPPGKVAKGPNNPVYYILTPKGPVLASKGSALASKGPILTSKGPTQLPQKPQTKVISQTTPGKSGVPVNVMKQSQLTVLDKNTIMRLQKNTQNNILFLTPTKSVPLKTSTVQNPNLILPSLSKSPTKTYTRSTSAINTKIQHVQVIEDSTLSQEESQTIEVPPNFLINNEKDDVVGLFVYPYEENDPSLLTVPQINDGSDPQPDELEGIQLMESVEDDEEEVIESYEEIPQTNEVKDEPEDVQIIETIQEDEEEVIIDSKEGILIGTEKNDPLDDVLIEPPSLVTPVDIEKILNEVNLLKAKAVEDRCKCNYMKNPIYMYRGFTRRETRKPTCYKYLQTLIKLNEAKIRDLKKSIASYEENFIHCGGTLNNFLPEVSKFEVYDSDDEYTIEYSSIATRIHSLQIPSVISKVNEQVRALKTTTTVNKKTREDIKSTLAEPEEALKLIQKGLELIRVWKDKANKSLPVTSTRKSVPVETKRRAKSIEPKVVTVPSPPKTAVRSRARKKVEISTPQEAIEVGKRKRTPKKQLDDEPVATEIGKRKRTPKKQLDDEPAIKKQTTDNRSKVQAVKAVKTATNVETKPARNRGRKNQTIEYNDPDPNDNELFMVKKVDILNDKRKRRK